MRTPVRCALATVAMCVGLMMADGADAQDLTAMGTAAIGVSSGDSAAAATKATGIPSDKPGVGNWADGGIDSRAEWLAVGPTARGAAVGVRATAPASLDRPLLAGVQQGRNVGQSKALMIVGGAALVAGLIIGDDAGALLAVGGAVVGLYGLYLFVR
jgi:hypothetical protein